MASRSDVRLLIVELALTTDLFPPSFPLTGVEFQDGGDVLEGGFAKIYIGTYRQQRVAMKRLRISRPGSEFKAQLKKVFRFLPSHLLHHT